MIAERQFNYVLIFGNTYAMGGWWHEDYALYMGSYILDFRLILQIFQRYEFHI